MARAEKDTKESKPSGKSSKQEENVRKAVEAMKKDGVDPKVARKVCTSCFWHGAPRTLLC